MWNNHQELDDRLFSMFAIMLIFIGTHDSVGGSGVLMHPEYTPVQCFFTMLSWRSQQSWLTHIFIIFLRGTINSYKLYSKSEFTDFVASLFAFAWVMMSVLL